MVSRFSLAIAMMTSPSVFFASEWIRVMSSPLPARMTSTLTSGYLALKAFTRSSPISGDPAL